MCVDELFSAFYSQYFPENDEDNDWSDNDVSSNGDDELHLSQAEDEMEQSFVRMDLSAVDEEEEELVTKFLSKDCCDNKCQTIIPDISKADIVAPLPKQELVSKKREAASSKKNLASKERMVPLPKKELASKKRMAKVSGDVLEPDVEQDPSSSQPTRRKVSRKTTTKKNTKTT